MWRSENFPWKIIGADPPFISMKDQYITNKNKNIIKKNERNINMLVGITLCSVHQPLFLYAAWEPPRWEGRARGPGVLYYITFTNVTTKLNLC